MNLILAVYSKNAFKEYMLPQINNTDHTIMLMKDDFGLEEDVHLRLEVINSQWKLKASSAYRIFAGNHICNSKELKGNTFFRINIGSDDLSVIVTSVVQAFHEMKKYSLNGVSEISIGKEEQNNIVYDAMGMVSRRHARIYKGKEGFEIESLSPNGIYVNSRRIAAKTRLRFGDYINIIGLHMVFLGNRLAVDTGAFSEESNFESPSTAPSVKVDANVLREEGEYNENTVFLDERKLISEGKQIYHRAPRYYDQLEEQSVEVKAPAVTERTAKQSFPAAIGPAFIMLLPLLIGVVLMIVSGVSESNRSDMLMYAGIAIAAVSALAGVLWTMKNLRNLGISEKEKDEALLIKYKKYLDDKQKEIDDINHAALRTLNSNYPSANRCLEYGSKNNMLWNRNRIHEDFLIHRIGRGAVPSPLHIKVPKDDELAGDMELMGRCGRMSEENAVIHGAPITIDLNAYSQIGMIGSRGENGVAQIAKSLSAQIAANNCYTDVKLAYIYDGDRSYNHESWSFAKWLPHTWSEDKKTRYIASTKEQAGEVFYELTNILRDRAGTNSNDVSSNKNNAIPKPYYVVFIADPHMMEGELFSKYASMNSENLGLTTVFLAETYEQLPYNCDYIIEKTEEFSGSYSVGDSKRTRIEFEFDPVDDHLFETSARKMTGLQVEEIEEGGELPDSVTFFEMMGVTHPEELSVREKWTKNRVYENIRGQIGVKANGTACYLDLHEKYHGPHGLVAGTTGSGKSELLQTLILSLAVNYSPEDISFLLIDYKGGGMSKLLEGLPHLSGCISNLSGNQIKRGMISIKSENRRRQRLFNETGVSNINQYTKLYKNGDLREPVPHLLIIIDEFAELKRQEPEFMDELISVAQVGRSLGIHLILATQKPSGTVDDNIWSNSKFRLCLGVQSRQDSLDMLHRPDAAFISNTGTGYLQVGNDEIFELFQSGYSGAVYDEDRVLRRGDAARLITLDGKTELSSGSIRSIGEASREKEDRTELDSVKEYISGVADEMGLSCNTMLWLPALGDRIYLDELPEETTQEGISLNVLIGTIDDPANQKQPPLTIDVLKDGNVGICGGIVSGKSTAMQTIAVAMIKKYTPEEVSIYVLDYSSKMMSAIKDAPHTGGVIYEDDLEETEKFFGMIQSVLDERKTLLKGGNYYEYIRTKGKKIPAIVIFIDNYSGFREKTDDRYEESMIRLSKEGVSHGIYLIISGSGFGVDGISTRVAENIGKVLALSIPDRYVYSDILHTSAIDVMPEHGVRGRGIVQTQGRVLEFQIALPARADNDYERMERIEEECRRISSQWHGAAARRIPLVPEKPEWGEFSKTEEYRALIGRDFNERTTVEYKRLLPVGYNADNAMIQSIRLDKTYCYGVYGKAGSGKSNFLNICMLAAKDKGAEVILIKKEDDDKEIFDHLSYLVPVFKERNNRKKQLQSEGAGDTAIFDAMAEETNPIFIIITDLADFVTRVYDSEYEMKGFLENILEKGRLHNIFFIGALNLEKIMDVAGFRIYELFIGYKTGIHLGGKAIDNSILDLDELTYEQQIKTERPGIGYMSEGGYKNRPVKAVIPYVPSGDETAI